MSLQPGARIGPYEVIAAIGRGAMGEVYRARDTELDRHVALKVQLDALTRDPERLARFRREAQVLASLNHANIAAIYGLEEAALSTVDPAAPPAKVLVLEYVEGPTLDDLLSRGALPLEEALPIARQIASALEAAHEAGVVHRDLKPANIKVKSDGTVKVLDFGLAKTGASPPTGSTAPDAATLDVGATREGLLLGTPAYMSPEQARGQPIDQRTDVWAFGCVLYELLTGERPFGGDTLADILGQILHREPDWSRLPPATPPAVRTLLRRCLEKSPRERLPHLGAARMEIADVIATGSVARQSPESLPGKRRSLRRGRLALAGVAVAVAAIVIWRAPSRTRVGAPPAPTRLSIDPEPAESWVISPHDPDFAISRAGDRIAYIGRRGAKSHVVVRRLDEFKGVALGDFGGAVRAPFFSPDGEWVAFVDGNALKKAAVDGSAVLTICPLAGYAGGATWAPDGNIYLGTLTGGLLRVPSAGGHPAPVTTEPGAEERSARWPDVLPGGREVLFGSVNSRGASEIRVRSLEDGREKLLVQDATFPRYAASGHLLYVAGGLLWAVRFDADGSEIVGDPAPVVDGVMIKGVGRAGMGAANVAVAENGTLVYRPSGAEGGGTATLVWVGRDGGEEPLGLAPRAYGRMALSPNDSRLAIEITDLHTGNTDIWVGDPHGETLSQLTFDPGADIYPIWTPDGARVAFSSERDGGGLFWTRADGTETEKRLVQGPRQLPNFATPDGRELVYVDARTRERPLYAVALADGHPVRKLAVHPGPVAALSPDGRWLANSSEETGDFEIYVQPLVNPEGARWRITTGGGRDPVWSRDGRELFYQRDTAMLAAAVSGEPAFSAASAVTLFEGPYVDSFGRWYDVAGDGRFLMVKPGWLVADRQAPLHVVLGWFGELERRVSSRE
jgi:serine/threonine-protein kinase